MPMNRHARTLSLPLAALLLWGCQAPFAGGQRAGIALEAVPETLGSPQALDWALNTVSSPAIARARASAMQRRVQAFPTATTPWSAGGVAGLPLSSFGASGSVPNGPAAALTLANQLFFLTKNGSLIKVDRAAPTTKYTTRALGKTFSKTSVTLSPACSRAYVLADDGTLFVLDTTTLATLATVSVAGGYGIAPYLDPFASAANDTRDVVYVAGNDGNVTKWVFTPGATPPAVTTSAATTYAVATSATPLYADPSCSSCKVKASPVVLNGAIMLGDQGGTFHYYDTLNTANNVNYGVGAPVNTSPAIEIQDGSYTGLTDPSGVPVTVAGGKPIYAFVNAGGSCAWINLIDTSITRSLGLRIDDNATGTKFGYLAQYNYSTAGTTETLTAVDGGSINTESPDRILPGYPTIWANDYLVPAETNTYDNGTSAAGGPVLGYARWQSSATYGAGSVITSATLNLQPAADQSCRVPEVHTTSPYYRSTTSNWASSGLTNTNRPAFGSGNSGVYMSGGLNASGNVGFMSNKNYQWDVSSAFTTPTKDYALGLQHNAGGDAVLWPWGPYGGASGSKGKAKKAYQVDAVMFNKTAQLQLNISSTVLPTPSIETPPVIDALNKRVYVFYTNALYQLDFSNPAAFADADVNPSTGVQTYHTLFSLAYYGDTATSGGATYNTKKSYVANYSAPLPNYNATAMYVISRYPAPNGASPSTWNYALSKFTLPLSATARNMAASSPTYTSAVAGTGIPTESSAYMVIDPFSNLGTTGGNVYFGLGNGRIYQYDP
jgi:hypothetical protein